METGRPQHPVGMTLREGSCLLGGGGIDPGTDHPLHPGRDRSLQESVGVGAGYLEMTVVVDPGAHAVMRGNSGAPRSTVAPAG